MNGLLLILLSHPLFGVALTIGSYALAVSLWEWSKRSPMLHPVFVATVLVGGVLLLTGLPYADYFVQAAPINWGLSLVVVLLSVPLYRRIGDIVAARSALMIALPVGSAVALASALAMAAALGADGSLLATLAPRSATAAVAVSIAEELGGIPGVTAALVISCGIFGAMFGPAILDAVHVEDDRARGFALGLASHAIGAARAIQISERAGAFAAIGMILNALLTIALAPMAVELVGALQSA